MTAPTRAQPARTHSRRRAVLFGVLAASIVGGSVPITGLLLHYPVLTGQAIRYLIGATVLYGWLRATGRRLPRPSPRDLVGLSAMVGLGMLGFNAAQLAAQRFATPGFVAAVLGASPVALALSGSLRRRGRPALAVLIGAAVVVTGVVLLSGGGSWHGPGLLLALLTMVGEVGFTLGGAGVAHRLGVLPACVWACLIAAVCGAGLGWLFGGSAAWRLPTGTEALVLGCLGVVVTAVAFGCWYTCVTALGADRAGVLTGLMPVAGLGASVALGAQPITTLAVFAALIVGLGCVIALRRSE